MLCNCSHYAEKDKLELSLGLWVNNISITSKCMQALKLSKNQSKYDLAILFFWRKLPFKPTLIRIMLVNGSFHLHQKMPKSVHHFQRLHNLTLCYFFTNKIPQSELKLTSNMQTKPIYFNLHFFHRQNTLQWVKTNK